MPWQLRGTFIWSVVSKSLRKYSVKSVNAVNTEYSQCNAQGAFILCAETCSMHSG